MTDYALHATSKAFEDTTTAKAIDMPIHVVDGSRELSASLRKDFLSDDVIGFDNLTEVPTTSKRISVLLCGNTNLDSESIAEKLHVCDQLGRRKLKTREYNVLAAPLFWLRPRKYWTVSKGESCLQDLSLEIVNAYLQANKDIVIVTEKDYRWRNKDPAKIMHRYETPGHIILCTQPLDNLNKMVGSSDDEQLLNNSIASCLFPLLTSGTMLSNTSATARVFALDRVGVRQSINSINSSDSSNEVSAPVYNSSRVVPDAAHPKISRRRLKQGSRSPDPSKRDNRKVTIAESDEYDLGDHATNSDKPTAKPNYAKEHAMEKRKGNKKNKLIGKGIDDCGDDITAIDDDDDSTFVTFSTDCPSISTECPFSEESLDKVYVSNMDEVFVFLQGHNSPHTQSKLHVVEIFGGHGGVTRIAIKRKLKTGQNFDINVGIDLTVAREKSKLLHYIDEHRPAVVVMGPPCTAFSGWARYNYQHAFDAWSKSYAVGYPLAVLAAEVAKKQMMAKRYFICENPWSSSIWDVPQWQVILPDCYVAYCDQCVFGLTDAAGEPTLKPTAFVSNSEALIANLHQKCNGRHAYHSPLAGTLFGMSKTWYAQQWPPKLSNAIVTAIEKICFHDCFQKEHAYAADVADQTVCPGCRAHAYRRDPKHNRVRGVCKFPDDTPDKWSCPACIRSLPSHHPLHTKIQGECHWSTAIPRMSSIRETSNSSRGPLPTRHIAPDTALSEPSAPTPPMSKLGRWYPVADLALVSKLDDVGYLDGWHNWEEEDKVIVASGVRMFREPQPRYNNADYDTRSTYARFLEHGHPHGFWWQLEDHVPYAGLERMIGYPVECLIQVFHRTVSTSSPTENKTPDTQDVVPPLSLTLGESVNEREQTVQRPKRVTIAPPEEVEFGEQEPEVPSVGIGGRTEEEPAEEDKVPEVVEWSSLDLGTTLRELRSENQSLVTRALRKLHLRWWHASATRMDQILRQAGLSILPQIKSVVDTCRICRAWKRPSAKSTAHLTQALGFNERAQLDLLFIEGHTILHIVDECTKFSMAEIILNREPTEVLSAIKRAWIRPFGIPKLFISDGEGALGSEEASIWAERLGTSFKMLPRGAHATVVERHHETLRQLIHRISSQLRTEGLTVPMSDVISEAILAKNSLLVINGYTPYEAVLGRNPQLLLEYERPSVSQLADDIGGKESKHASRLREIAVASMIEGTAKERINRAKQTQTRLAGEQMELQVNDLVDIYRTPRTKDNVGWRGPAKVVSVAGLEQGFINVQWGGRIMSCRIQDLRKALMYHTMFQQEDEAFDLLKRVATNLHNTCETYGIVFADKGWQLSDAAKKNPNVFYAMLKTAHDMFQMPRCIGGRIGRGIAHTNGLFGCEASILVWWPCHNPQLYRSMSCSAKANINLKELFAENWLDYCWIRLFGTDEESQSAIRRLAPDIPYLGMQPPPGTMRQPPAQPIPMDEDDTMRPDTTDTMSTATRIVTPMSTDHGQPPGPSRPPAPRVARQPIPISTDRSRSRHAPSTETKSISSIQTPTATVSHETSNRTTDGTTTPRQLQSPRGDKRPIPSGNSDISTKQPTKEQRHKARQSNNYTPASSSTDTPPQQTNLHEPLLPIDDDESDDDQTVGVDTDHETDLFATLDKWLSSETETNEIYDWDCMFLSRNAPPQYHDWELHPGIDEIAECQDQYLTNATFTTEHQQIRTDTEHDDGPELEIGPNMSAWFADVPQLQPDEILVFKASAKTTSPVIEKNFDALTADDVKKNYKIVEEAIRKEVASFVEHKTFTRAMRKDCQNVCTSRWVLRWKEIDGKRAVKARLTIRGFQDLAEVPSYASTAARWTQRLVISIAAQRNWDLWTADVSTAFLRGMDFSELSKITGSEIRDVAFVPPKGSEKYFTELHGLHDLNFAVEVLKLLKAVYGLRDAPRAWRMRLDAELRSLGGVPLPTDKSLYCFYDKKQELEALISTHVDDLKGTGTTARTKAILDGLTKAFGKLKTEVNNFIHCGIRHDRIAEGYVIHQAHYAEQLRCVDVSSLDQSQPDKLLDPVFISQYLSLLGGLSWLIQTRIDIAIYVCALQRAATKATTGHLLKLNKLTKWTRRKKFVLTYLKMKGPCKLLAISDSAFKTEPNSALAMRGAILGICEERPGEVGGTTHVLEFYARKQRRVCRSTFAAELNGIADAVEVSRLINLTVACCYKPFVSPQELQKLEDHGNMPLAIEVCTDCRSVYDALAAEDTRTPSESSLVLILHVLKELLRARVISKLTWVHTDDMLADGLTKGGVSRKALFEFVNVGKWTLRHDSKTHTEKEQTAISESFMTQVSRGLSQLTNQWFRKSLP